MTETADVVVIGGGVVGASVAYHLTESGCRDVLVVERAARECAGSTGRATGGVRAQFGTEINVRLSLYSIDFFARFAEATGRECGYEPNGYLFFATSEEEFELLKKNRERQIEWGVKNVELLDGEEVAGMVPLLRADDVRGATFCPTDGLIDPVAVTRGLTECARERGARAWMGAEVEGVDVEGGRVACVRTTRGRVSTRGVVNAAGAWGASVARMAGVELPVVPLRRHLVATRAVAGVDEALPMVIEVADGFHFRRLGRAGQNGRDGGRGLLLAWCEPGEIECASEELDAGFVPKILARAARRVPRLEGVEADLSQSRAGLYEMTPDRHAIVGEAPGVGGFYLANGFSGHGVMHSPATGKMIAELITEGRVKTFDAAPLGLERFAEGKLFEDAGLL